MTPLTLRVYSQRVWVWFEYEKHWLSIRNTHFVCGENDTWSWTWQLWWLIVFVDAAIDFVFAYRRFLHCAACTVCFNVYTIERTLTRTYFHSKSVSLSFCLQRKNEKKRIFKIETRASTALRKKQKRNSNRNGQINEILIKNLCIFQSIASSTCAVCSVHSAFLGINYESGKLL